MNRISSGFTFFNKWFLLLGWIGFLGFFVYEAVQEGAAQSDPMFVVIPIGMAIVGAFFMWKLFWDLADSVDDCGSYLLVRRGSIEERVELASIMNISVSTFQNPPRITLRLVKPGALGKEISFSPRKPFSLNPFAQNPVAEDLMERIHLARAGKGF